MECQNPPNITTELKSVSTTLGSLVTLECPVTGGCPSTKITWYKDYVAVSSGQYLVIQAVTLSDRGFYTCKAVNNFGYASSSELKLSIKGWSVGSYFIPT